MSDQQNIFGQHLSRVGGPSPASANPFGVSMTTAAGLMAGDSWSVGLFDRIRRRTDWNARFEHWEKPASSTEESTLDRAQRMVKEALGQSVWLAMQGATVEPQGSYHNNTNTRIDSDADLRLQLPLIRLEYHPNVVVQSARTVLGHGDSGWSYSQLFTMMRWELETCLGEAFGKKNVVSGKKAFRVAGVTGSRAEIDIVPTLGYQNVMWWDWASRYNTIEGAAILSTDGRWTINFPAQHRANGVAKRNFTGHQFKRVVRIFKRLRSDLVSRGLLQSEVPSYLVESLIYNVEDGFFLITGDDRYDRVRRIAQRLRWMLRDEPTAASMFEINGIKRLFTADQAWTWAGAIAFADAVVALLGDA